MAKKCFNVQKNTSGGGIDAFSTLFYRIPLHFIHYKTIVEIDLVTSHVRKPRLWSRMKCTRMSSTSAIVLSFHWGHEEPTGVARSAAIVCCLRNEMKDQPLSLNSAVDLWPWVHFNLGFLTSFDRLSELRCLALSSLNERSQKSQP